MTDHNWLLYGAAVAVLRAWDAEEPMEKNDLSDELWVAMDELRPLVEEMRSIGEHEQNESIKQEWREAGWHG